MEIGVDVGQTLIPIIQNFTALRLPFSYTGVDIRKDENLVEILNQFILDKNHIVRYEIANSLDWLPKCKKEYDIIFLDGDHNYQTVFSELNHIKNILSPGGFLVCDDYQNSKWSKNDLYYSTRESHSGIDIATRQPKETKKAGVKAAIDDWIMENPGWEIKIPLKNCEAVIIKRKD